MGVLQFILKRKALITFIILEIISCYLILQNNNFEETQFLHSANSFTAGVHNKYNNVVKYLSLDTVNKQLMLENELLKNQLSELEGLKSSGVEPDSNSVIRKFDFLMAEVINSSISKSNNYLTINIGENHGVQPDMGVIAPSGVVGVVRTVSSNYSTVLTLLNTKIGLSAMLKKSDTYGVVSWDRKSYRRSKLQEIPSHVNISIGDTVVSSGFSTYFPKNLNVGFISDLNTEDFDNFREITLNLAVDFKSLKYVYVVKNNSAEEIRNLEEITYNE